MLIMSKVFDKRINSWNFYVESTFGEYLKFAKKLLIIMSCKEKE